VVGLPSVLCPLYSVLRLCTLALMPETPRYYVFVDLENRPQIDLAPIAGQPVHVALLLGKNHTKLPLTLVEQIKDLTAQVDLVKVGASGHNALDLVLAAHLGRATIKHPDAEFAIVSKDKDFDPLVAQLQTIKIRVSRHPDFAALPFFNRPRRAAAPAARPVAASRPAAARLHPPAPVAAPAPASGDRLEKLIERLTAGNAPRPKRKQRLLRHIGTAYGNKLSEAELEAVAAKLSARGVIAIDANDRVSYPMTDD
jgi:hypothetical protein